MHILLTRQLQDSKDLIQKFKSNGFKVSNLPLLEINKLDTHTIIKIPHPKKNILSFIYNYLKIIKIYKSIFNTKTLFLFPKK